MAAIVNALNICSGNPGLLLNSGWNCTPIKNLCEGISSISILLPLSLSPENIIPFSLNSSGNYIEPTDISTGDLVGCSAEGESVESMLVRISNVQVTQSSNEFGEWYVDDGTGAVMINNKIFD